MLQHRKLSISTALSRAALQVTARVRVGSSFARSQRCDRSGSPRSGRSLAGAASSFEYCQAVKASDAVMTEWPCGKSALEAARKFVKDAASRGGKIVLAPDRDADGLCAGEHWDVCTSLI